MTLVGKGVCFDTGGLDIKPSSAMALMKKDMGGAATTLALAAMLMDSALPLRLRVLLADRRKFDFRECVPHQRHLSQPQGSDGRDRQHRRRGKTHSRRCARLCERKPAGSSLRFRDSDRRRARGARAGTAALLHRRRRARRRDRRAMAGTVNDPVWRMPLWDNYDSGLDGKISDRRERDERRLFAGRSSRRCSCAAS